MKAIKVMALFRELRDSIGFVVGRVMIPCDPARLHAYFAALPGSDRIASAFALEGLAYWLERRRPERVCDIGAGIGTTTALIALWSEAEIIAVEDHPLCQESANLNLRHCRTAGGIIWYDKIPSYMVFEFVVLDGPQVRAEDWGCLAESAVVFVEGGRRGQRAVLEAALRARGRPFCRAQWKPPTTRGKGFHLYLLEPLWWERLWFAAVRLREGWRDGWARRLGMPIGKRRTGHG